LVAHGVGAAVGEHVEKDVLGFQQEGVEASFLHRLFAPFDWTQVELLDDPYFVEFQRDFLTAEKLDLRCA